MTERNVYREPEDRVLLRTADVYQTEAEDDVSSYSDRLLSIVADFKNSGAPEGFNAQSMVGKSKRGEVACRLFARIDPQTGIIEAVGFKTRGCLAMTACASAACMLIEGKPLEDALKLTVDDIREYVDGVPAGKVNALHFAVCGVRALVGDFLMRDGASISEIDEALPCDEASISCIMAEHCSQRQSMWEMRADEEEERRAIAENNACAECFDLIRRQTLQGKLAKPSDWKHLVPAHMTSQEFTDAVLERLEDAVDDTEEQIGSIESKNETISQPSRFANRGVGIPTIFNKSPKREETDPSKPASKLKQTDSPTENHADRSDERSVDHSVLADTPHVYDYSRSHEEETDDLDDLVPPEGYELVEVDGEWGLLPTNKPRDERMKDIDASGIRIMQGTSEIYLYDGSHMTNSFARWAYLAEEDDPIATFAYCVREDSRLYPRPMAESSFANDPFDMSAQDVQNIWHQIEGSPDYSDIHQISASNGDVYYYSSDHLSADHAASLAEWSSVERLYNV